MTTHLLVVGERVESRSMRNDEEFDAVAIRAGRRGNTPKNFVVRRCSSPRDLVKVVRSVAVEFGRIETLDIHDHGASGQIDLGDGILFGADGEGFAIAQELAPLLTLDARVRLLGCDTATGERGRKLLRDLRKAFGAGIVVYGTIDNIGVGEFNENGFIKKYIEEQFLFSSLEAEAKPAPSFEERIFALQDWATRQRALL